VEPLAQRLRIAAYLGERRPKDVPARTGEQVRTMTIVDEPFRPVVVLKAVDLERDAFGDPGKVQAKRRPAVEDHRDLGRRCR
jgi:hypothetical protein